MKDFPARRELAALPAEERAAGRHHPIPACRENAHRNRQAPPGQLAGSILKEKPMGLLDGKVAIITGASKGIGRALRGPRARDD